MDTLIYSNPLQNSYTLAVDKQTALYAKELVDISEWFKTLKIQIWVSNKDENSYLISLPLTNYQAAEKEIFSFIINHKKHYPEKFNVFKVISSNYSEFEWVMI